MNKELNNGAFSIIADDSLNEQNYNNNTSQFSSKKNRHHNYGNTNDTKGTTNGSTNNGTTNGTTTTTKPAGFGAVPHPVFDSINVMEKLRNVEAGQHLLNSVYRNLSPNDLIVEEIRNEARRKLVEPELLPEDIIEPVDRVFTIGCFDLFHAGHELLLKRMRAYGRQVKCGFLLIPSLCEILWHTHC